MCCFLWTEYSAVLHHKLEEVAGLGTVQMHAIDIEWHTVTYCESEMKPLLAIRTYIIRSQRCHAGA